MAIIDTLRPTATLSSAGWTVTPSGTADEVTSDDSDATFVTGDLDSSSLVLSVGPHGVPTDHMRHLARVRARGEDGDVVASVRLPSGNQVAFSSISLPSTVGSVNGSWGAGLPPSVAGSYGVVVTAQDDDVDVTELWLDIDSRARPTFALDVLDAGTPTSVVTTTNTPTLSFETIVLDGLPPRQWRAWVTLGGAIVWDSGIVAGAATTVDTAPLVNGGYVAHAQVWSTVGGVNEFPSAEVTETFSVNVQPVAGPTSIDVVQRPGTPLFDITVGIPSGLGDYDDDLAYVEVQRTDCDGEWSTIGLEQVASDRLIEDFEDTVLTVTLIDSGDDPWARSTDNQHTGAYSLRSGVITDNETSRVTIIVPSGYHTLHFWYSVSSERGFDYLRMYVDDIEIDIDQFSGEIPWTRKTIDITGVTTIAFQYEKDVSVAEGSDAAWIDDFVFVGATAATASFVDWTAPRAVTGPECDPDAPCEFQYRARLVGLKDGVLVTSEWLYETEQTALAQWRMDDNTRNPTVELDCDASTLGGGWLYVTGDAGSYASTPDDVAVDITGDIDVRAMIAPVDWTPNTDSCIAAKYATTSDQRSWHLTLQPAGNLRFAWSTDGTSGGVTNHDSVVTGYTNGTTHWVRVTRDSTTGDVVFYTSENGDLWTQLGTTQSGASGAMFDSSAALTVGGRVDGDVANAKIFYFELHDGINGTVVANPNFRIRGSGTSSFSDNAGRTWSYNGAAIVQQLIISTSSFGYATDPVLLCSPLANTGITSGIFFAGRVDETTVPLGQLRRIASLVARGGSSTPRGFAIFTSYDGFATPVYATTVPTQRTTWTSYDFVLNVPVTGSGIEVRVYPYVAGAGQSLDFDNITFTFGEPVTHTLEWPTSDVLLRTFDASGPLWHSACGDVQWERVRPFTNELGVMGDQKVRSNVPGGRDYTLNLSVTAQEDVEALERIFARQLVLVSPVDLPEQWVGPVSQSVDVLKVKRARSTSIKTIGTGPEPPHSPQEVIG